MISHLLIYKHGVILRVSVDNDTSNQGQNRNFNTRNHSFVKRCISRIESSLFFGIQNQSCWPMKDCEIVLLGMQGFLMSSSQSF